MGEPAVVDAQPGQEARRRAPGWPRCAGRRRPRTSAGRRGAGPGAPRRRRRWRRARGSPGRSPWQRSTAMRCRARNHPRSTSAGPDRRHLEVEDGGDVHVLVRRGRCRAARPPTAATAGGSGSGRWSRHHAQPLGRARAGAPPFARPGQVRAPVLELVGEEPSRAGPPPMRAGQDGAAAQRLPVEAVDRGQGVEERAVQPGLPVGRGLGQPPHPQVGLLGLHHPPRHPGHEQEGGAHPRRRPPPPPGAPRPARRRRPARVWSRPCMTRS